MPHPIRQIIDLTLPIDSRLPNATVQPMKSIATDGWRATRLNLYSHCGTHMDATCHFLPDGETLDQLNLEACCGVARIINLAPVEPSESITIDRFMDAAGEDLAPGARLLLRTDWHHRYPSPEYRDHLPRISAELAHWLVQKQVRLVGVEPPSVADVNNIDEVTEVHHILFRGGIVIVEGLIGLDQIPVPECQFIALPLRVADGDGCPVRAIAIVPGDEPAPTSAFGFHRQPQQGASL
ncbi:Kynurenine formamidase [Rubripirellula lacrimiformis]|uniref:Kynurenine formamidase n=1 Tax=Rubripirellula lacrimiformis TaxID=1930273 RepID=A0A517NLN3_9BACT|nr:cyclase family protein [Rubripirellula lacrimiformis]QDT08035.1 Kynurenine formamidase [Rubripirellula lacrimiformis]